MNILNSADTAATINKIIHNAQGTTTTTEGATAAGKIIKENLPDIISAGFDMPHPTSVFEGVPPFSFISNGDPLVNWSIYGNTVEGVSVGDRTKNLFSVTMESGTINADGIPDLSTTRIRSSNFIILEAGTYTLNATAISVLNVFVFIYNLDNTFVERIPVTWTSVPYTFTIANKSKVKFVFAFVPTTTINPTDVSDIMVNTGDTALPYEPYGYKIPVICGGVTTNIYIDEPLTAGETISYNDTGVIIPTSMFLNTLSVGTTVQPEKVFIEYVK